MVMVVYYSKSNAHMVIKDFTQLNADIITSTQSTMNATLNIMWMLHYGRIKGVPNLTWLVCLHCLCFCRL